MILEVCSRRGSEFQRYVDKIVMERRCMLCINCLRASTASDKVGSWEKIEKRDPKILLKKEKTMWPCWKPIHQADQLPFLVCISPLSPKSNRSRIKESNIYFGCTMRWLQIQHYVQWYFFLLVLIYALPAARLFWVWYLTLENWPHEFAGTTLLNLFWNCRWLYGVKWETLIGNCNDHMAEVQPYKSCCLQILWPWCHCMLPGKRSLHW